MSNIRRRIGHFVYKENETFDFAVAEKDFDEECYEELKKYVDLIFKLQPILISYESTELSYNELAGIIQKYSNYFLKAKGLSATQIGTFLSYLVESTQKTLNFLSSVTSFLSCAEAILKDEFGENSNEFNEWNEYRKTLHSKYFSYRFLYEMRNYSQHKHLPVSKIDIKLDNIVIGKTIISNTISIDRDKLLNSGYNWPKGLRNDIGKLEKKIDLSPIINDYMDLVRKIAHKYIDTYKEKIEKCFSYMDTLNQVFAFPANSTPVIYIGETLKGGQPVPRQVEFIPFSQFMWISKRYFQLKKHATRA